MRLEICIDANDMEKMADFWCLALGYTRGGEYDGIYLNLVPMPPKQGNIIFLQKVPEVKTVKNRVHLDVYAQNAKQHIQTLLQHGASEYSLPGSDGGLWWQVLLDPEGNEFCVMQETKDTVPTAANVI